MENSIQATNSRRMIRALTLIAVLAAMFWFTWTLLLWFRWHPHLPWRDLFVILEDLQPLLDGEGGWRGWLFLFEPHYAAHRIAVPRLLVALDVTVFSGRGHLLYGAAWLALFSLALIYLRMSRGYFESRGGPFLFSASVLLVLLFSPAHFWNLANAVNSSWHISFALAALSFAVLLRRAEGPRAGDWFLAYGLATLCALTTFAGVVLWLLLPALALGSDRRTLLITLGTSTILALLYLNGIASDAEIAMSWEGDNELVVEQIKAAGRDALAANSPLRIFERTAGLLCWPLSGTRPLLSLLLFSLSLPVLTIVGIRFLRARLGGGSPLQPWLQFCLMLSLMALGVALAVALGRVIEQPNHAHGPSYERYNTIVAVYWAGVFGLLLALAGRYGQRASAVAMSGILLWLGLLLVPGGSYLEQEINSLEAAASLYAGGETPGLRGKVDKKLLRFKPEFVYSFDPLFRDRELAYMRPAEKIAAVTELPDCRPGLANVSLSSSAKTGYGAVTAALLGPGQALVRDVLLSANERLVARLQPVHHGDYSPLQLLSPAANDWQGYLALVPELGDGLQLNLVLPWGISAHCHVPATALAVEEGVPTVRQVIPDV